MVERGRASMAPSRAFLHNKQSRNTSQDGNKNYLNAKGSVNSSAGKIDRNGNMIPSTVI
jgi:hypothetical protein